MIRTEEDHKEAVSREAQLRAAGKSGLLAEVDGVRSTEWHPDHAPSLDEVLKKKKGK